MKFLKFLKFTAISLILTSMMIIQAAAAPYVTYKLNYDGKNHIYAQEEVYLKVNGERLSNLPMPPIIMDGNTLVPAREVFERLGAKVAWKDKEQEVDVLYNNIFVVMHINNKNAVVAGNNMSMSVAPKIINNKTMIPLRFVGESVGLDVGWDKDSRTASVDEPKPIVITTEASPVIVTEKPTETTTVTTTTVIATATTTETTTETSTETTSEDLINYSGNFNMISSGSKKNSAVTGIFVPTGNSNNFVISASSTLSDVKVYPVEDNKLTLDILNAENKLVENSYKVEYPYVKSIVASQYQTSPFVTRVVFDIDPASKFDVNFSADKTNIIVAFKQNSVDKIEVSNDNGNDVVKIISSMPPSVNMSRSSDNTKIIADLPYSMLNMKVDTLKVNNFIDTITYSQFSTTSVRVVLNLKSIICDYNTSTSGNTVTITVGNVSNSNGAEEKPAEEKPNNQNTSASQVSTPYTSVYSITLPKGNMTINNYDIKHIDNYTNKNYTLIFPKNYSSVFGDGKTIVDNNYINSYTISSTSENTIISISEKKILAYNINSDENFVYINAVLPKEKYKNIVVVDAGHGGSDVGATGNGLYEKNLTLDIVEKIIALFDADDNIKVYATRSSDVYPGFRDRTDLADEVGDIFVSVHINSAANGAATGTESYHYNGKSTPSGLSSQMLASKLQSKLLSYLGSIDRGVKPGDFFVIRETSVPAALCEIGFISNSSDAAKMGTDEYRQKAAQAIYEGCKELFEAYPNR